MDGADLLTMAKSSSSSLTFHIPPLTVKLDRDNFSLWRTTIVSALETFNLESFVFSPSPPQETRLIPGEDGTVTTEPNPAYVDWKQKDRYVLLWLKSTMTEKALAIVARAATSHAAWLALDRTFQSQTTARRMTLKVQLQTLVKGSLPMIDYVEKKRAIADTLAENLTPVSDEDLIGHILGGLDSSYGPFLTAFMMRSEAATVDDLVGLLLREEVKLERDHQLLSNQMLQPPPNPTMQLPTNPTMQAPLLPTPSAYAANRSPSQGRSFHSPQRAGPTRRLTGHSSNLGHRGSSSSRYSSTSRSSFADRPSAIICQLCGRANHSAIDCWQRSNQADYPSRRQPPKDYGRQANLAQHSSSSSVVDPSWYFDSGATDHVSPDLHKLTLSDDYTGFDKLQVGDDLTGQASSSRGHP
ncbi:Retrovirus-related Pol polyprotein from transposon RE1 [Linum perenne]